MKPFYLILLTLFAANVFAKPEIDRPDIILIMVDDMGFSDLGFMGGEIDTPNLDALAHGGVRFSQFYNSGRCCPTRATLMTGLHPHQTGIGWMTEPPGSSRGDNEPPAYAGNLNDQCATVAEALKSTGYATLMAGKWHLGYDEKEDWPLQRGFEKYFGCISGATRFFYPDGNRGMAFGNESIAEPESTTDEAFYTTDAFTDYAIRFLQEENEGEGRPAFLYLAYTAPHWPLQAFEDDIAKYRGKYREGWKALREERYRRQFESGLIDGAWPLSEATPGIPEWESLDEKKRDEMDLKMAIYAAMIDRVDQNIGKLVTYLKESGTYDDTLILFLSDNGGCQEGGMLGRGEFFDVEKRNLEPSNSYGEAWANASNTPFRLYKHYVHEGGAATPFFMHWPASISAQKDWFGEPAQLIDIVPTILDVAGAEYTDRADVPALDGVSLRPAFDSGELERDGPIFVEHEDNAFARDGNWKLVGKGVSAPGGVDRAKWELYDIAKDRTETNDLAAAHPEVVSELAAKWDQWAEKVGVFPKKNPASKEPKAEPDPLQVKGRAFSLSATVRAPEPSSGVAISHGGVQFGYSLHFKKGKPTFSIRDAGKLTELVAEKPVKGKATVMAKLDEEKMSISVNGKIVASRKSPGLMTGQPAIGMYIGEDFKDPVGNYKVPNKFTGKLISHSAEAIIPKVTMRTRWAEEVTAENVWQEYPRPQMRRDAWTNLNGHWGYAVTAKADTDVPKKWDGEILVPFAIEAPLSGVEKRFTPDDALWYRRSFESEKKDGKRYLLNFEAVDYESTVWVNDTKIGSHTGGNLPFSFDMTDALVDGGNTVIVRVTDATDSAYQLHGKQRLNPKGIWYTPVSGIWQTVWMEEVDDTYLTSVNITPKISGRVRIDLSSEGGGRADAVATAYLGEVKIASAKAKGDMIQLSIPSPRFWSPEKPNLYDLVIEFGDDVVHSYFGIRETGIETDADGHLRFTLNGHPIFHWGTLDQGWWPDGLLTPPGDEAMVSDIEFLKAAGFNTIRKHIKVEPRRYYYHCDKIGMLVWQDQVSAMADNPEWTRLVPGPATVEWPAEAHAQYMTELEEMMHLLHSHPCIVQWVPFNERWGQHQTMEVGEWTVAQDPSRQVNVASGGNFFPVGHIVDAHKYPHPEFPWDDGKGGRFDGFVKVLGEFGGHGFPVEGHVWDTNARNWGYGGLPKDKEEWLERYRTSIEMLAELKQQGIAAGIYTQTTDVEGEINGLITYDRKVQKIAPEELREIARPLFP